MAHDKRPKPGADTSASLLDAPARSAQPGKRTLTEALAPQTVTEATRAPEDGTHDDQASQIATSRGGATPAAPLPHAATIQQLFGNHRISGIQAHAGRRAAASAAGMGAGRSGAVPGERMPGGGQRGAAVQRAEAAPDRTAGRADADIATPVGGIDKTGFIDNSDGAFLRTGPRDAGGTLVRGAPLAPAIRVFATGRHPSAPEWIYVTAFLAQEMVRGYVQSLRINFDLPEPLAELRQLHGGETVEGFAKEKFGHAVRDGHDLRFYENVLLHVNQGRAGISGTYQDPGVLGGGANNIQLTAGHRIWLVSAEFAKSLESIVPSGSLTGGAVARARRFAGHVQDILHSVTESRHYLGEVAGEYAQAIREHQNAIFGIVGGFLMAEAASALLAATPTGVTQIIAVLIQLTLSALGAAGMVEAGAATMQHGAAWLTTAWTASGKVEKLADASREFIKMLVSLAMAALSYLGAKGNYGNALKIANSIPTGGLPALAVVGGGQMGGAGAGTGVLVGPSTGSLGIGGAMMSKAEGEGEGSSSESTSKSADPVKELEDIKSRLESDNKLSGKEKKALRARKKELQEQLGQTTNEPTADAAPPTSYKRRAPGLSGKEAATDIPSWAKNWPDARPGVDENGIAFATRMMNKRYGAGGWVREGQQGTEFSELKKFGDRAFE